MTLTDIATVRLHSQQIADTHLKTVKDLVGWMGALQAQDYPMVQWAMGLRLPGATRQAILMALDDGEVIRTHVLRPTWHVVAAQDVYWMLELTAPRIKDTMKSRHRTLELTEVVVTKSHALLENALEGGRHLTREELVSVLQNAGVATHDNRASHLLMRAELDGILGSGRHQGNKPTYALLEERVPKTKPLLREEALAKLARTYFSSHGPATLRDFVWWSGLTVTEARQGLEMVRSVLASETVFDQTYWFDPAFAEAQEKPESVFLLPAFDEYIISYQDRSAVLTMKDHKQAVSKNGIFWPVIVVGGRVAGTWKRTFQRGKILLETKFFQPPAESVKEAVEQAAGAFGQFVNKPVEMMHHFS